MKQHIKYSLLAIAIGLCPLAANAGPVVGWVFVSPAGNDSTCSTQASRDGNIIAPPMTVVPCKTWTKACSLLPTTPPNFAANWVVEGTPGSYVESVVCNGVQGSDPSNPLNIIGANPGTAQQGPANLKSASASKPAWEMNGSFIYLNKIGFSGSPGDALYVHGADVFHEANDVVIGYNTTFANNGGYAIHGNYTYWLLIYQDYIFNNAANPGTLGCVLIENSAYWLMSQNGIRNCGALSGVPPTPKPGVVANKTQNGQYFTNTLQDGASPNLQLNDSVGQLIVNNATKPPAAPFSYQVNSAKGPSEAAYELSTDVISGN